MRRSPRQLRTSTVVALVLGGAVVVSVTTGIILTALLGGGPSPVTATDSTGSDSTTTAADGVVAQSVLADGTGMGSVELVVRDLVAMRDYYGDAIGLEVLREDDESVSLGADGIELLILTSDDALDDDDPAQAGLYHTAFLYADSPALAGVLSSIAAAAPETYQGAADHAVSLAFYFGDPEGNGVELYVDRPSDEWEWDDGTVTMGSAALDPNEFIATYGSTEPEQTAPIVGHVHLRVGDIDEARDFYEGVVGFAVTSVSDASLFLSAGGYHHHLAANTWSSAGAGDRPESLGLRAFSVELADAEELHAAAARLDEAGRAYSLDAGVLVVDDPWGNTLRLAAAG